MPFDHERLEAYQVALDFFDEMPDELARAWREGRVFVWCGVCEDTCGVALPEETPHA